MNERGHSGTRFPSGQPFTYTTRPQPTWTKVVGGIVIAGAAVVALIVVGVTWMLWSAFSPSHTGTDHTVTAARTKAKPTAESDVARLVSSISPVLGQPSLRAFVDWCQTASPETWSNDIKCERSYYLFYPAAQEPGGFAASDLVPLIPKAGSWQKEPDDFCNYTAAGQTTTCFRRNSDFLQVTQNAAASEASLRVQAPGSLDQVEAEGYTELARTASSVPGVVLVFTNQYFYG
jgi:hypothetical protein